jgi:acylphosphatase
VSTPAQDRVRVVAVVSGQVQGVGYRWFVRNLAEAAALAGSARNRTDGRVEVVLEGRADDVARVVAALNMSVDTRTEPVRKISRFTTA